MQPKRLNVRVGKWREMLKNDIFNDVELLKSRLRKGIPACMRILVWPRLIHLQRLKLEQQWIYQKLLQENSPVEEEISLDIPRTFTQQKSEIMRKSLFNVLKALSIAFPEVGYCQGMNTLAMRFLQTVDDETAFWIMVYLLKRHKNLFLNLRNPRFAQRQNYVLDKLLKKHIPSVHQKLIVDQDISLLTVTPRWFITLFSSSLPQEVFYRLMDCFLYEGYKIAYRASLALFKFNQQKIMNNKYQENLKLLMHDDSVAEGIEPDQFVELLFLYSLKKQELEETEEEFMMRHQTLVKKLDHESSVLQQKRVKEFQQMKRLQEVGLENAVETLPTINASPGRFKKPTFEF